ncbi:MAG: PAS domain S-box protein [Planctomycetes bacterium]|nr:PAS domain S-box protein [Planctomycetota bacterium]
MKTASSEAGRGAPGRGSSLTPTRRRLLTAVIVGSVTASFVLELASKYVRVNPLAAEGLSFFAATILSLSCVYLAFQGSEARGVRLTGVLGASFLIASQVLNVCDDLHALDAVAVLGKGSPAHEPAKQLLLVAGFAMLIASFYSSLLETLESRSRLAEKQEVLTREFAERTAVAQRLRESEARLAGILEVAHEAVISIDESQRIILFNKAAEQVFGYAAGEVVGQHVDLLIPERFREAHRRYVEQFGASAATARQMGERGEILGRRKGGTEFPAEASISKLVLPDQKVFTVLLRDVTERRRTEEKVQEAYVELERNERMLRDALAKLRKSHEELQATQLQLIQAEKLKLVGQLGAGVAHQVKNPLAVILMGIELLSSRLAARDPELPGVLKDMDVAVKKADAVIRGLLDFSASRELDVRPESLNDVIEQALQLVKYELDRSRVVLSKGLAQDLPPLLLDRNKLEQAFVNVLMNAVQAMPDGGTLQVNTFVRSTDGAGPSIAGPGADREPRRVVVAELLDSGQGISAKHLAKIYDPFFSTKSRGKGTGLGLSVTRTIVELHGASIDIRNRPEGGVRAAIEFKA